MEKSRTESGPKIAHPVILENCPLMDSPLKKRFNCLLLLLGLCSPAVILGMNHSESIGVLSVSIAGGSEEAPSFTLFSPGVKASSIFRGPVKSVMEKQCDFL